MERQQWEYKATRMSVHDGGYNPQLNGDLGLDSRTDANVSKLKVLGEVITAAANKENYEFDDPTWELVSVVPDTMVLDNRDEEEVKKRGKGARLKTQFVTCFWKRPKVD